jgi:hypothetical protein
MEHPPAFLSAADEATEISTKINQDEPDFSCGIRDEGSGVKDCLVFHGISFPLIQHDLTSVNRPSIIPQHIRD